MIPLMRFPEIFNSRGITQTARTECHLSAAVLRRKMGGDYPCSGEKCEGRRNACDGLEEEKERYRVSGDVLPIGKGIGPGYENGSSHDIAQGDETHVPS